MSALDAIKIAKSLVRGLGEAPMPAKPFYSPLDKAIAEITQTKGTGQQIEQILKKTKGVSKELKDRPVIQELLRQPKVTKEQLTKAATENPAAQVMEKVEKGPSETSYRVEHDELNDRFDVVDDYSNVVKSFRDYDDADAYAGKLQGGTTKYEDYQLPGGKNYREIKLMIPTESGKQHNVLQNKIDAYEAKGAELRSQHPIISERSPETQEKIQMLRDLADELRQQQKDLSKKSFDPTFRSTHFPESNILAHARVSDRVGPNGEKILHVEEIQSDWHQKGRKKGYFSKDNPRVATSAVDKGGYYEVKDQNNNFVANVAHHDMGENVTPENAVTIANSRIQFPEAGRQAPDPRVPDAPFKENWHELVMKRLLDDATKKGYDRVVITPAEEQLKRYPGTEKHFGEISYLHNPDGTISVIGKDKSTGSVNLHEEDLPKDELVKKVGRELADRIMANEGLAYEGSSKKLLGSMTIPDLDVKHGGKFHRTLYDTKIPSFLNEYGKKWSASVGQHELSVPRKQPISSIQDAIDQGLVSKDEVLAMDQAQRNALMDSFRNENIPVHSFDITPQMREEITGKGQPLYQMIPAGVGAGTLAAPQEEVPEQPMKRGGAVSMDAMRLAVMNKQLRK